MRSLAAVSALDRGHAQACWDVSILLLCEYTIITIYYYVLLLLLLLLRNAPPPITNPSQIIVSRMAVLLHDPSTMASFDAQVRCWTMPASAGAGGGGQSSRLLVARSKAPSAREAQRRSRDSFLPVSSHFRRK